MKTKVGRKILKQNAKAMDSLNADMINLALDIRDYKPHSSQTFENWWAMIYRRYQQNRREHARLQEEVNAIVRLESLFK